jgi:hypothetical protein
VEKCLELRLNNTDIKILHSYENIGNIKNKIFISNCALKKIFKVDCYLHLTSTKVTALQLFNICHEDKLQRTK